MESGRKYIAIDLKSFYASVECVDKGLDPLTTNLVVADPSRTEKTICLAVSPSLKSYHISGRARLFEVVARVRELNELRRQLAPGRRLTSRSYDNPTVRSNPSVALDYIVAPPRMARYMEVSSQVFATYLKYVSSEDILVYSCDEVFADVTDYLKLYGCDAHGLALRMIRDVLATTGITATAGIGTNLFLAKVAMDVKAYTPQSTSISSDQVLHEPYTKAKARTVISEMVDGLCLDLVAKRVKTDQIVIAVGYDIRSAEGFSGELVADWYGRTVPKPAHGSVNLGRFSSSTSHILEAVLGLYDRIVDGRLLVRRLNVTANHIVTDEEAGALALPGLFDEPVDDARERKIQDKSYNDIIDIQYPVKTDRPRMSLHDRASQFAPFAALTGYEELIGETVRHNDEAMENGTEE